MADPAMPGAKPPTTPDEAPMGAAPVTGPTPNKGFEAAALQRLGIAIKILTDILNLTGPASEPGKAVMKALQGLVKFVPPGAVSPASEQQNLQRMQMQNTQNNAQMAALKPQMPPGGAGGGAPPPGQQQAA